MIQSYHDQVSNHDDFVMIAIHDSSLKSLAEVNKNTESARDKYWKGEELPFPVLLDKNGKTEEVFGITAHPSHVLIDPEGNVVGYSSVKELEKKLPTLPAEILWTRHLDLQKNVHWTYDEPSIEEVLKGYRNMSRLEIEVDEEALDQLGLNKDSKLPIFMDGYGVTMRSISQIIFHANGLAIEPSKDGESLVLTKRTRSAMPLSHFQLAHKEELEKRIANQPRPKPAKKKSGIWKTLDAAKSLVQKGTEATTKKVNPLTIDELELAAALKKIAKHFELPIGIDSTAYGANATKVSGLIKNDSLAQSLNEMLEPAGLRVMVKFEIVLVVPIDQ